MEVRHRGKQPVQESHCAISQNDSKSSHRLMSQRLHRSVWSRVLSIIGLFVAMSIIFSRKRSHWAHLITTESSRSSSESLRFVTIVMPSVVRPEARPLRLASIAKTWGPPSRSIYVVHSVNEFPEASNNLISSASENNLYPQLLLVPDNISVEMGVQRLDHVIRSVHKNINPDFAFFVNDHTFVIPDNLCKFLKDKDSSTDLYAGHALKGKQESVFNSGAAGYVLSRSTIEKLISQWDEPHSKCSPSGASKWIQGNPGLLTAKCFDEVLNIRALDTRDNNLSHMFHAFGLVRTVTGSVDEWYLNKHVALDAVFGVDNVHHHKPQDGAMCCSPSSISFHYVEGPESLALWKVLEAVHSMPTMSTEEIMSMMIKVWPVGRENLGFYAHGLPAPSSSGLWDEIVKVVRKIAMTANPHAAC